MGAQVICPYRHTWEQARHLRVCGDVGQVINLKYNPKDPRELYEITRRANVVINLVGRNVTNYYGEGPKDSNVDTTARIAEVCFVFIFFFIIFFFCFLIHSFIQAAAAANVDRFIHVSALGVDENSPSVFFKTKAQGEKLVRDIFPSATILRPANFFGFEDKLLNMFARAIRYGPGVLEVRSGQAKIQPVYVCCFQFSLFFPPYLLKQIKLSWTTLDKLLPLLSRIPPRLEIFSNSAAPTFGN